MQPTDWLLSIDPSKFSRSVLQWYDQHARSFPWRNSSDPYRIWVAEIMLQQTTTETVARVFDRFFETFPTIDALARSGEQEVLHAWRGLGYYRRARLLHQAARQICLGHDGALPRDPAALARLPGFGKYTASAVACFSWGARAPILEANTVRLWTRLAAAEGDPARQPLRRALWRLAEQVLPQKRCADFQQALMDIGATVCTPRQPDCRRCPVQSFCAAHTVGNVEDFPQHAPRKELVDAAHVCVAVRWRDQLLLTQRPPEGRWAGLWELPCAELMDGESMTDAARRALQGVLVSKVAIGPTLAAIKHGIMRYRVTLTCVEGAVARSTKPPRLLNDASARFADAAALATLPLSSPQRRLVKLLTESPRNSDAGAGSA